MFNSDHVRCFVTVVRLGSFTKAAAELYLSQQAVSRYIVSLENRLGVKLFVRERGGLKLTSEGKYYDMLFKAAFSKLDMAIEEINSYYYKIKHTLTVGCTEWIDPFGEINTAIQAFRRENPDVTLLLDHGTNREICHGLAEGEFDAAMLSEGHVPVNYEMEAAPIANEELALFGPADVVGSELSQDRKAGRSELPYLIAPAWERSHTEDRLLGKQEAIDLGLPTASIKYVPNIESLRAEMMLSRGMAVSDARFGFLSRIGGLGCERFDDSTCLYCCYMSLNENLLVDSFIESMRKTLKYKPDKAKT